MRQLVERSISRYRGETRETILKGPAGAALSALDRAPDDARGADAALGATVLAVFKPAGMTCFGHRRQKLSRDAARTGPARSR